MSIALLIYFAGMFGSIGTVCIFIIIFSCIAMIIFGIMLIVTGYCNNKEDLEYMTAKGNFNKSLAVLIIASAIVCIVPSEKTVYMMLGANIAGKTEIPQKLVDVIDLKLTEILNESKGGSK